MYAVQRVSTLEPYNACSTPYIHPKGSDYTIPWDISGWGGRRRWTEQYFDIYKKCSNGRGIGQHCPTSSKRVVSTLVEDQPIQASNQAIEPM